MFLFKMTLNMFSGNFILGLIIFKLTLDLMLFNFADLILIITEIRNSQDLRQACTNTWRLLVQNEIHNSQKL